MCVYMHRCKSPSQAEIVLDVCSILKEKFKHSLHLMIICMILMKNREVFHHMARSLFLLTCVCSLISSRMNLKVIYMAIGFLVMSLEKCFWPKQTYEIWYTDVNSIFIQLRSEQKVNREYRCQELVVSLN